MKYQIIAGGYLMLGMALMYILLFGTPDKVESQTDPQQHEKEEGHETFRIVPKTQAS
jgi:hypothetical protein